MPLIFVHLRWNDPGPGRFEEIIRAIPQDGDLPPGCLSRQLRRTGGALMASETWDSEASGGRMDHLVMALRAAGVEGEPLTAMFSVPAMFDIAYRRPAAAAADHAMATATATATATVVPEQRGALSHERPLGSAASTTVSR